ncbi:transmembrane protein 72 [Thalassophryne amazonica]|uniref:transmembrane protein 72 n=1 Tax=Thalassophryne amazonica TaxID=390379 RepID=UPI00147234D3|nr:transmembrane protein 72 [Thalassophryne amazonica]
MPLTYPRNHLKRVSSVGIIVFELAYFVDALLIMCLPCPPDWEIFMLWGKMARIGSFHKFLYYAVMSVVCFVHPVLVWHAVIPGVMLLVTATFNFILSKKTKTKSPKRPQEGYRDQSLALVTINERTGSDNTLFNMVTGSKEAGLPPTTRDCLGDRAESSQAMLEQEQTAAPKEADRDPRRWKDRRDIYFRGREEPLEQELEMEKYYELEPDITSDTAPMINN